VKEYELVFSTLSNNHLYYVSSDGLLNYYRVSKMGIPGFKEQKVIDITNYIQKKTRKLEDIIIFVINHMDENCEEPIEEIMSKGISRERFLSLVEAINKNKLTEIKNAMFTRAEEQ